MQDFVSDHQQKVIIYKKKKIEKIRKQILSILPRGYLEDVIDNVKRPQAMSRQELEKQAIECWEDLEDIAMKYLLAAKKDGSL